MFKFDVIVRLAITNVQLTRTHHKHNDVFLVFKRITNLMNSLILNERAQFLW